MFFCGLFEVKRTKFIVGEVNLFIPLFTVIFRFLFKGKAVQYSRAVCYSLIDSYRRPIGLSIVTFIFST
jgi:hypothetical protein